MDIIARSVLNFIQQKFPNTILAGGACRDEYIGIAPKDYDIFVPGHMKFSELESEFAITNVTNKSQEYDAEPQKKKWRNKYVEDHNLDNVTAFEVEGRKFDIMMHTTTDDEEFAQKVISKFDYGINMIYFDGSHMNDTSDLFMNDINYGTMSLINLKGMDYLPKAVRKFQLLNDRIVQAERGNYSFRAPCLQLKEVIDKPVLKSVDVEDDFEFDNPPLLQPQPQVFAAGIGDNNNLWNPAPPPPMGNNNFGIPQQQINQGQNALQNLLNQLNINNN